MKCVSHEKRCIFQLVRCIFLSGGRQIRNKTDRPPNISGGRHLQNEMYILSEKMYISTGEMYLKYTSLQLKYTSLYLKHASDSLSGGHCNIYLVLALMGFHM